MKMNLLFSCNKQTYSLSMLDQRTCHNGDEGIFLNKIKENSHRVSFQLCEKIRFNEKPTTARTDDA